MAAPTAAMRSAGSVTSVLAPEVLTPVETARALLKSCASRRALWLDCFALPVGVRVATGVGVGVAVGIGVGTGVGSAVGTGVGIGVGAGVGVGVGAGVGVAEGGGIAAAMAARSQPTSLPSVPWLL